MDEAIAPKIMRARPVSKTSDVIFFWRRKKVQEDIEQWEKEKKEFDEKETEERQKREQEREAREERERIKREKEERSRAREEGDAIFICDKSECKEEIKGTHTHNLYVNQSVIYMY